MIDGIFLQKGTTLLPDDVLLEDVFFNRVQLSKTELEDWDLSRTRVYGSFLQDTNLKDIGADRMVRKTTERQSRWMISSGVKTWQALAPHAVGGDNTGLYIGLGSVDCDESEEHDYIDACTPQSLSEYKLSHNKPLLGLILLNSTAASHISQMTGITGHNCCFAPLTDSGSNALIEAAYDLTEDKIALALCGGGSQKIAPWYFLAYEDYWQKHQQLWLTESTSFFTATRESGAGQAQLRHVYRGCLHERDNPVTQVLSRALADAKAADFGLGQIIFIGCLHQQALMGELCREQAPGVAHCFIEEQVGYTGAAGMAIGVNLALTMLEKNLCLEHDQVLDMPAEHKRSVLLVALGAEQQISYLSIGDKEVNE